MWGIFIHESNFTEVCIARACWLRIEKIETKPGVQHKDMLKIGEIMFYAKKHKLEEGDLSIFCECRLRRMVHILLSIIQNTRCHYFFTEIE